MFLSFLWLIIAVFYLWTNLAPLLRCDPSNCFSLLTKRITSYFQPSVTSGNCWVCCFPLVCSLPLGGRFHLQIWDSGEPLWRSPGLSMHGTPCSFLLSCFSFPQLCCLLNTIRRHALFQCSVSAVKPGSCLQAVSLVNHRIYLPFLSLKDHSRVLLFCPLSKNCCFMSFVWFLVICSRRAVPMLLIVLCSELEVFLFKLY